MMLALIAEALVYRAADVLGALAPLAAIALAVVFAIAAVTKLADRPATTDEFAALGLPAPGLLALVVPPTELAVAGLLLVRPSVGALVATLLLLAFTAVLVAVLRTGRSVTCGCLGVLSRQPVSTTTLARNAALIGLAALTSIGAETDGFRPALPALEVVLSTGLALLLAVLGYHLLALRNQIGRLWSVELAGEADRPTRHRLSIESDARMNGAAS